MSYFLIGAYILFFAFVGGVAFIVFFGLVSLALTIFINAYEKLNGIEGEKNE